MISQPVRCRRYIGRREQLNALGRAFAAVCEGPGAIVLIAGDAGTGKSRLVSEFCATIPSTSGRRAIGHCLEYAQSPFAPILSVLRAYLADEPNALSDREDIRKPLGRLLPELRGGAEDTATGDKIQQFDAMAATLRHLAKAKPAIIVLEDLHWADASTLEFLQHLLLSLSSSRVLLLGTYRPEELSRGHMLASALARIERHAAVLRIDIEPLSSVDMISLIYDALEDRAPLPSEVIGAIHAQAEGNPLFAEELLKNALENAGVPEVPLPRTLREAVLERLDSFDRDERRLLVEASVIGRRFQAEFLAAVAETPLRQTLEVLRRARDLQLIVEESHETVYYAFRHALTREAIYSELLISEARPIHGRIGAALEASATPAAHLAELAYHWWKARDPDKAPRYNELAGEQALRIYAYRDSLVNFERALEFDSIKGAQRASLQRKLAKALHQSGMGEQARHAIDAALEYYLSAEDWDNAAWTCLSLARICSTLGDIGSQIEMVERALALAGKNAFSPALFGALVAMAHLQTTYRCDTVKALEHLASANHQRDSARPRDTVRFFETHAMLHVLVGRPRESLDDVRAACEVANAADDVQSAIRCWANLAVTLTQAGEPELALQAFEHAHDIVRERRFGGLTGAWVMIEFAHARLLEGDLEGGRELIESALAANIETLRFRMLLARTGILIGLMLESEDLVHRCTRRDLIDFAIKSGAMNVAEVSAAFSEYYLARRKTDAARSLLHHAIETFHRLGIYPPGNADWLLAIAKHGDPLDIPRAREFLERAAQSTRVRSIPACLALFDAYSASRDKRQDEAGVKGFEAAALFHGIEWPYHEAQGLELAGRQKAALEIYRRIGDLRDARRLDALLNPPNRRGRRKNVLTDRELEISELIAGGKSNRAVAEALVISERTVESHVSAILNKLGFASRNELIAQLKEK